MDLFSIFRVGLFFNNDFFVNFIQNVSTKKYKIKNCDLILQKICFL